MYLGKDVLGSVRTTTGVNGSIEERYEYDVFGVPYQGDLTQGMDLGYTGKPYDAVTGLYDYGYRDYKAEVARFTSIDPIRDGSNWYAYVNNDPVNWVDPWGLEAYVYVWEEDGKTYVDILIPITYIGEGATPEVIKKFNDGIEKYWSGIFGKYDVQTVVTNDTSIGIMNTITVPLGDGRAKTYVSKPEGTWPSERPEWTAAHDAGHLLGLHDMYNRKTNKPYDTWEENIMAKRDEWPDERNIDEILMARGPDNTIRSGSTGSTTRSANEPLVTAENPSKKNH